MLKPYDNVHPLRLEIRMYGEDLTPKHNIQMAKDTKTTLKHM